MAYLRDLGENCGSCGKPATVELLNQWNSRMGSYCHRCGHIALKRLLAEEDRERTKQSW